MFVVRFKDCQTNPEQLHQNVHLVILGCLLEINLILKAVNCAKNGNVAFKLKVSFNCLKDIKFYRTEQKQIQQKIRNFSFICKSSVFGRNDFPLKNVLIIKHLIGSRS